MTGLQTTVYLLIGSLQLQLQGIHIPYKEGVVVLSFVKRNMVVLFANGHIMFYIVLVRQLFLIIYGVPVPGRDVIYFKKMFMNSFADVRFHIILEVDTRKFKRMR